MSTILEIAEAYESLRTSAESGDKAYGYQVLSELAGISSVRAKLQGEGRPDCLDCGYDIPLDRREAVKNAVRCKPCQDDHDKREARFHG